MDVLSSDLTFSGVEDGSVLGGLLVKNDPSWSNNGPNMVAKWFQTGPWRFNIGPMGLTSNDVEDGRGSNMVQSRPSASPEKLQDDPQGVLASSKMEQHKGKTAPKEQREEQIGKKIDIFQILISLTKHGL